MEGTELKWALNSSGPTTLVAKGRKGCKDPSGAWMGVTWVMLHLTGNREPPAFLERPGLIGAKSRAVHRVAWCSPSGIPGI